MKVAQLMTKDPVTCSRTSTLDRAAKVMREHDCGAVPVTDDRGRAVGIVTDRDICMAALARGRPLSEIPVAVAASDALVSARADDSAEEVARLMQVHRIRRVPILDADGAAVGIVALADLVKHLADGDAEDGLDASAMARTVAVVSRPRGTASGRPGAGKDLVFHIRSVDGGWVVFDTGGHHVSEVQRAQSDAVVHAKELARRAGSAQIIVHRIDGSVASEFFYQHDERSALSSDDTVPTLAASRPAHARRGGQGANR